MKTVFEGEIIDVVSANNGIVIAYVLEKLEDKIRVAYKLVSFDNGEIANVRSDLYDLSKFGTNYKIIASSIKNHIYCHSVVLPNEKTFVIDTDGSAYLFDANASLIWRSVIKYKGTVPSGLAINNRHIWVGFSEYDVLMRLNLATMSEELRLGGGKNSPFKKPNNLFINNNDIYLTSLNSTEIIKIDTSSYTIKVYKNFNTPIKQYLCSGGYEFAVLENGVYLLD